LFPQILASLGTFTCLLDERESEIQISQHRKWSKRPLDEKNGPPLFLILPNIWTLVIMGKGREEGEGDVGRDVGYVGKVGWIENTNVFTPC
jgi:hypothetical protein